MERKTIIHIGLHKTGSTFLQTQIFPFFNDINYITRPYTQFNAEFNKMQYADDTLYNPSKLSDFFNSLNGSPLLLSDENFSGKLFSYNYINRTIIANRMKELLPHATIVIFIRNQSDMINSIYNHYVKGVYKGTKAIHKFIKTDSIPYEDYSADRANAKISNYSDYLFYNTDDISLNLDLLKYHEMIGLYTSLFKDVKVLLYEDLVNRPNYILEELNRLIGTECTVDVRNFKNKENASLKDAELYAQIKLNQSNSSNKLLKKLLMQYHGMKQNTDFLKLDITFVKNYFNENNNLLQATYPEIQLDRYNEFYF